MTSHKLHHYYQSHRWIRYTLLLLACSGFGLLWFLLLYGSAPLYLTNVDWIYSAGGDTFQHQIGWEWFRQEPWRFPLGRIDAYGYPFGTSISFMDSIPLFAILFKILTPLLNEQFQYLGLWDLTSIIGQLFFGFLILREFTQSNIKSFLGAFLLVLSPVLIFRTFYQSSLTAHWIILAGIWFTLLEYKHRLWRGSWIVLFMVAMLVHLYFVAMLVPLWVISLFFLFKREKKTRSVAIEVLTLTILLLGEGYCLGLFNLPLNNLEEWGFGYYSWNLNGFINSNGNSLFFNKLPLGSQSKTEGFSYIGLGNIIIFLFAIILFIKKELSPRHLQFLLPFLIVFTFFCLFSLSNKGYVNNYLLWDVRLPDALMHLCSLFRASGRFIWPAFYFIVLFGLICILRNFRFATPLLILALAIQFIDIQPLYSAKRITGFSDYQSPLQSEFWQAAASTNKHIILIPTHYKILDIYEPVVLYARKNKISLNWGYFARADYDSINNYADQAWEDLINNQSDNQTLYLFWDPEWDAKITDMLSNSMTICQVDGFTVVLSSENGLAPTNPAVLKECSFSQNSGSVTVLIVSTAISASE